MVEIHDDFRCVVIHQVHRTSLSEDFFLADPSIPIHAIGKKMVSRLMSTCESDAGLRNEDMDNLKVLAFGVILQELGHQPEVKCSSHMDLIVAVYISFYDAIDSSSE